MLTATSILVTDVRNGHHQHHCYGNSDRQQDGQGQSGLQRPGRLNRGYTVSHHIFTDEYCKKSQYDKGFIILITRKCFILAN